MNDPRRRRLRPPPTSPPPRASLVWLMRPDRTSGHIQEVVEVPLFHPAARPLLGALVEERRLGVVAARTGVVVGHAVLALAPLPPAPRATLRQRLPLARRRRHRCTRRELLLGRRRLAVGARLGCGVELLGPLQVHRVDPLGRFRHRGRPLHLLGRGSGRVRRHDAPRDLHQLVEGVNLAVRAARPPLAGVMEHGRGRVVPARRAVVRLVVKVLLAPVVFAVWLLGVGCATAICLRPPHQPHLALVGQYPGRRVGLPQDAHVRVRERRVVLDLEDHAGAVERRIWKLLIVRAHEGVLHLVHALLEPRGRQSDGQLMVR
mmetsp:Transcript_4447/g.14591  ORF Transcript_4447/g.14591 Transcript_4447/m.14591 type:complete len:318 (+) Transcript_4447:162-1115(+)